MGHGAGPDPMLAPYSPHRPPAGPATGTTTNYSRANEQSALFQKNGNLVQRSIRVARCCNMIFMRCLGSILTTSVFHFFSVISRNFRMFPKYFREKPRNFIPPKSRLRGFRVFQEILYTSPQRIRQPHRLSCATTCERTKLTGVVLKVIR